MRRLKIGPRLTLSFAIIVLLMFFGSVVGLWQLNVMRVQALRLHHIDAEVETILRTHNSFLILQDRLQHLIQTRDRRRLKEEVSALSADLADHLKQSIQILQNSPANDDNPTYQHYLTQLRNTQASLTTHIDAVRALATGGDWAAAELRLESSIAPESRRIQELVNDISTTVAAEQNSALENMVRAQRQALTATAVTGTLILVAAGILGFAVTRSIAHPLALLDDGAKALARREFTHRIPSSGHDELTRLSRLFNDTARQLANLYTGLEELVQQRTQALQENSEELRHRYLQLETGIGIGQRVTSILDLDTLLHEVVEIIRDRFGYYYVGVFLVDKEGDYIVMRAGTGPAGRLLCRQKFRLKIGREGISGWVAQNRRPLRVNDVSQEERYIPLPETPETRAECALPIAMGGKLLGVLDIQSREVMTFRMEDMPVLQSLADQIAIAIQNATLYQGEKSRRQLAETLYHVGRDLARTLDLREVLDLILEHLAAIVPYDRAAVMLKNHDTLECVAARGFPPPVDPLQMRVPIQAGEDDVFRQIYRSHQPLIIADVSKAPVWDHIPGLPQACSWLGVPLIRFDNVIGMLSLTREVMTAYDEEQARLAVTFAGQAATALENARLYDKIARFTQQLEDMVKERTEALQEAYLRLEHLDQTKTDFINIAAHELRTPLTVLRGYSQMILNDKTIQKNSRHQEIIASIHAGAIRLHEIVNSMLDITKIDSRALTLYPEPLAIQPVVELVRQDFKSSLAERNQTLSLKSLDTLPTIEADPDALRKVFYHLISNAIKYTPDEGHITISGRPLLKGEYKASAIEIIVSDTGIGIEPDFHELIFTKFYQTGELALHSSSKTNFKGSGPGLGLAIARGIVEAHQGQLWVESKGFDEEKLPGSHFHVLLPLRQTNAEGQEAALPERLRPGGQGPTTK